IATGSYTSRRFDAAQGLPADDALSLAPAPDGCWVGTMRGLAVVTNGDKVIPVGNVSQPVLSLVAVRESLWVGTAGGLRLLASGSSDVAVTPGVAGQPALRAPILALPLTGDTLVGVTPDQFPARGPAPGGGIRPTAGHLRATRRCGARPGRRRGARPAGRNDPRRFDRSLSRGRALPHRLAVVRGHRMARDRGGAVRPRRGGCPAHRCARLSRNSVG